MTTANVPVLGTPVICSDNVVLGLFEADEGTHYRVRRKTIPPLVWVAKFLVTDVSDGAVRLLLPRDDLHDGVIALSPARQREYGTLEAMSLLARRVREAGRA
jgi:hypothetical protein